MEYYEEPTALYGDDPTVLAVVNVHPDELFPRLIRQSLVRDPMPGVALVDGFPDAARQNNRCLNGIPKLGNLNMQFNYEADDIDVLSSIEQETLARTRTRAGELFKMADDFDGRVIDFHGCGNHYPTSAWIGDKPSIGTLAFISALGCREVMVSLPRNLTGALRTAVSPEVNDADADHYIEKVRLALGAYAVGALKPPSESQLHEISWCKFVGVLTADDLKRLSLDGDLFAPYEELPSRVAEFLGREGQVLHLATAASGMELVTSISLDDIELPSSVLGDASEAAA